MPALIVSYSAGPGGAERILADHATALGEDTCVACPEGWLADALRERGLRVFAIPRRPLELRGQSAAAALRLAAHSREVRMLASNLAPRVVVAWGMRSLLACALARLEAPLVFQHNDLLPSPAVARAVRAAARRCALTIALSDAIARDLALPGTRVIHPGVDLERFTPGRAPERPSALFLAALVGWKRPQLAVDACALAGLPLVVAGAGPNPPRGAAELVGRVEDPRARLRAASCLIHTADREPFGLALVEALACGVPVVAPGAGGPLEIVDHSCGRLFEPGDARSAAAALAAVAADGDLRTAARARAERHFDLRRSRAAWAGAVAAVAEPAQPARGEGIAFVTVLHDSEREVRALAASIERHLPGARLVAADSGSRDAGADVVCGRGGTVVDLGGNAGFGRGTNAGIAAVDEPVTVVVNPDVELLDSSLAQLARAALRSDRILAPLVVQPDGAREPSAHPEPPELALALAPPGLLPPPLRERALPSTANAPRRAAWAAGCCLVARTDLLRRLGPFDASVFLYGEDMELGLRAKDAGVETWFCPSARVLHARAHSTERAFGGEAFELLAERRAEVVEQRRGRRRRNLDTTAQLVTFAGRAALKALLRRPNDRERAQRAAAWRQRSSSAFR